MKPRKCPVCNAKMLVYENPPRLKCPRENKHHQYLLGPLSKGFTSLGRKKKKK